MIDGVVIQPLKQIKDDRGMVMHMLRSDSELFEKFGEVYFSVTNPGVIKGWKKHYEAVQLFTVPVGKMKVVIFDNRDNSPSNGQIQEVELGIEDYKLLKIPSGVWYGFKAISREPSMICNMTTLAHDPEESTTKDLNSSDIPYAW